MLVIFPGGNCSCRIMQACIVQGWHETCFGNTRLSPVLSRFKLYYIYEICMLVGWFHGIPTLVRFFNVEVWILKAIVYSRSLIKRINTWTVPQVRISGPFLKWRREEFQQMGKRTKKKKKINDEALGNTFKRSYRQAIWVEKRRKRRIYLH